MWDCRRGRWSMGLAAVAAACWLGACGGASEGPAVDEGSEIKALDLETGETKFFPGPDVVPPGWGICADDACSIPPNIPCAMLGVRLCIDQPECAVRLTCDLDFGGGIVFEGLAASSTTSTPENIVGDNGSADCHMSCIAKDATSCDEAQTADVCSGLSGCVWAPSENCYIAMEQAAMVYPPPPVQCPMVCRSGKPHPIPVPTDPCEQYRDGESCSQDAACDWEVIGQCQGSAGETIEPAHCEIGVCKSKMTVESCYDLDKDGCTTHRECMWAQGPCMLCPQGSAPGCGTCPEICQPRPVPPPTPTPEICAAARDSKTCDQRPECMWLPIQFDNACIPGATLCTTPPEQMGKCVDRPAPESCFGLNTRECLALPDTCEWGAWYCLNFACPEGQDCPDPCPSVCHPKREIVPPPPVTCEDLSDATTCEGSESCEWQILGQTTCFCIKAPCDCGEPFGRCVTKTPESPCKALDQAACGERPKECAWQEQFCPMMPCTPEYCPPCGGVCEPITKPVEPGPCYVGGCSGEICSSTPGMVSACIYPPTAGLPAKGAVCQLGADGRCAWLVPGVSIVPVPSATTTTILY